ncbi:unnamed protein product [Calicophoron daubneyi]|uniref:Uncharacterized protein n=1 Tax=Calicophoron daubneyi TaxID=300641 RepID=A0AAV2T0R7_CALDB
MHAHMRMARFAGIGVLVLSWYPKGLADANGKPVDDLVLPLLNVAQSYGLKVCLHIEPYGNRTAASVASDLIYAHFRGYTTHPAYFRLPRRLGNGSDTTLLPVFFVYDSYRISNLEWTSILSTDGAMSIRKKAHDGYMIGLLMEITSCQNLRDSGFDGGYTYFVGSSTSEASSTSNWKKLSVSCLAAGLEFYPSIGPGYHDLSIRPWNRKTVVARSGGDKFYESYSAATKVTPSGLGITSFNEWHEGSQVEPAVPKSGPHSYMDYSPFSPEFYLRLVRLFVNHFEGFTSLPHSFWLAPDNEVNRLKKINDTLSLL